MFLSFSFEFNSRFSDPPIVDYKEVASCWPGVIMIKNMYFEGASHSIDYQMIKEDLAIAVPKF